MAPDVPGAGMAPDIRIGTMLKADRAGAAERAGRLAAAGFESVQPFFWRTTGGVDLPDLAARLRDALAPRGATVEALGVFGNPLEADGEETRRSIERAIDAAEAFGATCVTGFTGRLRGRPIDESLPRFAEAWSELARRAEDRGVRIAFETCAMGGDWRSGDWNVAHGPAAWARMFDAVPSEALGLEWEPCHAMVALADPLPQIAEWAPRIWHVHGKDATIRWDVIRRHGVIGPEPFAWMRTPGFGECDWTAVISELRRAGWRGGHRRRGLARPRLSRRAGDGGPDARAGPPQALPRRRPARRARQPRVSGARRALAGDGEPSATARRAPRRRRIARGTPRRGHAGPDAGRAMG